MARVTPRIKIPFTHLFSKSISAEIEDFSVSLVPNDRLIQTNPAVKATPASIASGMAMLR